VRRLAAAFLSSNAHRSKAAATPSSSQEKHLRFDSYANV
jgi:hypothetical protein